jgi:hypothetical protein
MHEYIPVQELEDHFLLEQEYLPPASAFHPTPPHRPEAALLLPEAGQGLQGGSLAGQGGQRPRVDVGLHVGRQQGDRSSQVNRVQSSQVTAKSEMYLFWVCSNTL